MKMRRLLVFTWLPLVAPLVALRAAPPQQGGANPHGDDRLECAQCHTAERWTPVEKTPGFKHDGTGFALEGAHGQVSCRDCHRSLVFTRVGTACADCHRDTHKGESACAARRATRPGAGRTSARWPTVTAARASR